MDVSAALANQNVAGLDKLTISALGTQALGVGVTYVLIWISKTLPKLVITVVCNERYIFGFGVAI